MAYSNKQKSLTVFGLVLFFSLLYGTQYYYCNFVGYCCWTNHVDRIKTVAVPLKNRLEKYYAEHQQYPELDEMGQFIKDTGCKNVVLTSIEKTAFSYNDNHEELIDINGKTIRDYKYICQVDSRELEIDVHENLIGSEFKDWQKQQLLQKKLGGGDIFLGMGNMSSCKLLFNEDELEMFCGKGSCLYWKQ